MPRRSGTGCSQTADGSPWARSEPGPVLRSSRLSRHREALTRRNAASDSALLGNVRSVGDRGRNRERAPNLAESLGFSAQPVTSLTGSPQVIYRLAFGNHL